MFLQSIFKLQLIKDQLSYKDYNKRITSGDNGNAQMKENQTVPRGNIQDGAVLDPPLVPLA